MKTRIKQNEKQNTTFSDPIQDKATKPRESYKTRKSVLYRRLDLPLRSVCMVIDSALPITSPFVCANLNFRMFPAPTCLLTQSIVREIDRRYLI